MYRVLSRPRVSKGFNGIVNAFSVASSTKVPASAEENILFHESRTHPHGFQRLSVSFIGTGTFPSVFRSSPCTVLNFGEYNL
ncbi:hypothetical protein EON65_24505 [archaeon]|nr:MAG: hypothetical protein EON65_24505 [archaeon]